MDVFETDNFPTAPETREEYDRLDFDARDELDDVYADDLRAALTGLPARPGTRR
ncbi:hypothetical protein [Micromonospora sp. NPDC047730]|uniref:hypothetical protein n=1 Tax=Micromonospora sp. NPDC047730 TaxID=3364253 RepID=UPI003712FBAE